MKIIAPAKINLYLHLTGRREDGYHLLDSLFAFTEFGDVISIMPADKLSLSIDGQFSNSLFFESIEDNLIYRAARMLQKQCDEMRGGASIRLTKNIPVSSGLGGGSSDAAAVLKGLNQLWDLQLDLKTLCELGLDLGADVPACIAHQSAIVRGIGEIIEPIALPFQSAPVLLINPNQPLSTRDVFTRYKTDGVPFTVASNDRPTFSDWKTFLDYLPNTQNDLESSAIQIQPEIQVLLTTLAKQSGCELARMSGSGATCFALFDTVESSKCSELILREAFPTYWIQRTQINW